MKKLIAEFIGTFWLVVGGCGSAIIAGNSIGALGVALAFGLAVLTGAYALGGISGGHFNPAVSVGMWAAGRFSAKLVPGYVVAQVLGAVLAGMFLCQIVSPWGLIKNDGIVSGVFATNGYGTLSPGGYGIIPALLVETVLTAMFLVVIAGVTGKDKYLGFAPMAIGLSLALIHLISIPVTNTSVNPARSTGVALMVGDGPVQQLWLFWVAPLAGAVIGALVARMLFAPKQ